MKKKLLLCGSAGFLMANFMRYLLYRSRDYEIVSVDKMKNDDEKKRIYFHQNHKFYIGDITDEVFINRIASFEAPDIIINGCFYNNQQDNQLQDIIKGTTNLLNLQIPVIQLCGCIEKSYDTLGFWNFINNLIITSGNTSIELPNVFGIRQRLEWMLGVPWIQYNMLKENRIFVRDVKVPWAYAEDVASLLWFIIEMMVTGHIKMPALGMLSEKDIAEKIKMVYNSSCEILVAKDGPGLVTKYEYERIRYWSPDSEDIDSLLVKTINWFEVNKNWAL